jgi:hypothetical protein
MDDFFAFHGRHRQELPVAEGQEVLVKMVVA